MESFWAEMKKGLMRLPRFVKNIKKNNNMGWSENITTLFSYFCCQTSGPLMILDPGSAPECLRIRTSSMERHLWNVWHQKLAQKTSGKYIKCYFEYQHFRSAKLHDMRLYPTWLTWLCLRTSVSAVKDPWGYREAE